jgi:hypothetical protein
MLQGDLVRLLHVVFDRVIGEHHLSLADLAPDQKMC